MATPLTLLHKRLTRRILKALTVFGSVEALSMLCNVVRTKAMALWVGTTGIGLMGLFVSALDMLCTITQIAIGNVTVRAIASATSEEKGKISAAVLTYGLLLGGAGIAFTALIAPMLSIFTFGNTGFTWAFAALGLAVGFRAYSTTSSAILQGHNMLSRIASASFISVPIVLAISILLIYYWRIDSILPIILVHSAVLALVLFILRYRPVDTEKATDMRWHECRKLWAGFARLGIFLSLAEALTMGANYILLSYINHIGGAEEMGLCQSGYSISIRYIGVVFTAMAIEYYPRISAVCGASRNDIASRTGTLMSHQTSVSLAVICPCALVMLFVAPWIVRLLYSSEFLPIVPMVLFAAAGLPLRAWSWAMGFVILAKGNGRLYLLTEAISIIIGLSLNIWGYSVAGFAGLGLSFVAWYALYSIIMAVTLRRCYNITTNPRTALLSLGCSATLMAIALTLV